MRRRETWIAGMVLAGAVAASPAGGVGTIDTSNASIAAGASSSVGDVTIDAAAPGTAPSLPSNGPPNPAPQMTGSLPAAPSYGNGGAALSTAGAVVLGAGTHEYASIQILPGGSITCNGAATILVTGDVELYGPLTSSADDAPITVRCGGHFVLQSTNPTNVLATTGAASPIEVTAGGALSVGSGLQGNDASLSVASGDVLLQSLSTSVNGRGLSLAGSSVRAPLGKVTLISAAELTIGSSGSQLGRVESGSGPLLLQSFSEGVNVLDAGVLVAGAGWPITIESANRITMGGSLEAQGPSPVTLACVSGTLSVNGRLTTVDGEMKLSCGGEIFMGSSGFPTAITATTGSADIRLESQQRITLRGEMTTISSNAELSCVAAGDVLISNGADIHFAGDMNIRSSGDDVIAQYDASIVTPRSVYIRAGGDLILAEAPDGKTSQGSTAVLRARYVDLSAGGNMLIDAAEVRATGSAFLAIAEGDIEVARTVTASRDIVFTSRSGDVDVAQTTLRTDGLSVQASGSITVETYKAGGTIDASGATIQTGDGGAVSGDISLLVHDTGGPPVIQSYVLPKRVRVEVVEGAPERTRLAASGFFDTGPDPLDLSAAAIITVGTKQFAVSGFELRGTKYFHTEEGLAVRLVPAKSGSSRAKFRLNTKGAALAGAFPRDGNVELGFNFGTVEGKGKVGLQGGNYVFGEKAGNLLEPNVFLVRAVAKLGAGGTDSLQLVAGLATDGAVPAVAPDVTVDFGDTFEGAIAGNAFRKKGARFTSTGNPRAMLDYAREQILLVTNGTTLGAFPEGPQPVTIRVGLGSETREVRVRMVRIGKKLVY